MNTFKEGWDAVARVVHLCLVVLGKGTAHGLENNTRPAFLQSQG